MSWQGVDFLGISLSDKSQVQKLDEFLNAHEDYLSKALVHQFQDTVGNGTLKEIDSRATKFTEASNEIRSIINNDAYRKIIVQNKDAWQQLIHKVNEILWEQVELIEGFVNELFHQLSYMSILKWHQSLREILESFSHVLLAHIDTLDKGISSLNETVQTFISKDNSKGLLSLFTRPWKERSGLDPELKSNLQNCRNILELHTHQFSEKFVQFEKISSDVKQHALKLKGYEVLDSLGNSTSEQFTELYRFVKLWESLSTLHTSSQEALLRSFQQFSREKTYALLKTYLKALETALFEKSRTIKSSPKELFSDAQGRSFLLDAVKGYQREVHLLGSTATKLKDFLLRSSPDPYVRARWGFADTPVGEPPRYAKVLTDFILSVEQLDRQYNKLLTALEKGPLADEAESFNDIDVDLSRSLHVLAQPLVTPEIFKSQTEKVLELLEGVNELGAYGRKQVDYTRYVLGKLLRADWKEHQLNSNSKFNQLYWQHQGIVGPSIDQGHDKRTQRFHQLLHQVRTKIRKDEHAHGHDVEYDISDIKGYLQDFYATLQRAQKDESIGPKRALRHVEEAAQQLLEYRYAFGDFFASLKNEPEGYYIRQQFLFADQYFEAIESKIYEMRLQRGLVKAEGETV